MAHTTKENRDVYYRKAKEDGYRARSAYKLIQIFQAFGIFYPILDESKAKSRILNAVAANNKAQLNRIVTIVDLCAAPGSWSQCIRDLAYNEYQCFQRGCKALANSITNEEIIAQCHKPPAIVSVDLQEMAPINGVQFIKGDITNGAILQAIKGKLAHHDNKETTMAQLVVCDGAPDVSGLHEMDAHVQSTLIRAALYACNDILEPNGTFICKAFGTSPQEPIYRLMSLFFKNVAIYKPAASRASSAECFIVAIGFQPPTRQDQKDETIWTAPILSSGDFSGYDKSLAHDASFNY
ncbi:bifunctional S-adenosyl-L-methionine-dependent methyltransferase superfamily/Ribosomal RNA large subunit methyltransferase E/tRNA (cytidine(32)-guanosine(34)-2-O)-methyltransferase [Babesia duncani]|uniref:Putative tRNA (cytidine(32)/guanosine(34)-2'-O)-methyltransferase n=1 Tax=Babesia duncani TaxID=323732 RepID=A0AAD9PLI4_9APIC|nr:bifunctional S-adenosyl-L-methionine-dependent methyltransferase superfamily/Ribosomal RNA large subunit methyltransferase E/tRNA (cytidine(32)-guanosine(34)-2-O)-methyltransferase [Babesia duncani]